MRLFTHIILLVNIIDCFISSASCIYQLRSMRIFSRQDLHGSFEHLSLPGQSLALVAEDGDHFYLGGRDAVYELQSSNISRFAKVATWPVGTNRASSGLVRSVYFPGNFSGAAFVCAIVGFGSHSCHRFDRGVSGGGFWSHTARAPVNPQISALLLPPSSTSKKTSQRPPLSLQRVGGGSRVFFAALPPIRDATDLVELTGPDFADIGFTTSDLYSRRSRNLWMARGARAYVMHEDGDRMYAVYTEPAAETSNYVDSVNAERPGLVKTPTFTRLARVCLNDPGQTIGNQTSPRVLTSFFKLRLICRHDGIDYDVLELATEVSNGQFIGLFAPQNSPPGGFRAVCRFRLADAERLLSGRGAGGVGGDFIEMLRPNWQSPWQASRLSRAEFLRRSDVSRPFDCVWTPADALRNRFNDLLVARMAALLALPMVSTALTVLPPEASSGRRPTALTLLPAEDVDGAELDQLLIGWDTGELTRLSANATMALSPAVETLQTLPRGQRVDAVLVRNRRLLVFGPDGISSLPLARCGSRSCASCGLLGDPLCVWLADEGSGCVDRAKLRDRPAAEVAAAAAATEACAIAARRNGSNARSRGQPMDPPAGRQDARQLASIGGSGSGHSTGADTVASAGIATGSFLGALVGVSLLAFLIGVALGVGCIAKVGASCNGKRPPRQQPTSVSTSSTSSSSTSRQQRAQRREAGLMSATSRFLLKGFVMRAAPTPTPDVAKLRAADERRPPNAKASDPLMQPQSTGALSERRRRCLDNEYVQVADLVSIATVVDVNRTASRCSSFESCLGDAAGGDRGASETVVQISDTSQPPPQQPQQRHQVTVNAGIIGQLSLRVGFNGQTS